MNTKLLRFQRRSYRPMYFSSEERKMIPSSRVSSIIYLKKGNFKPRDQTYQDSLDYKKKINESKKEWGVASFLLLIYVTMIYKKEPVYCPNLFGNKPVELI